MQHIVKELCELSYSRTKLSKQKAAIEAKLSEVQEYVSQNTAQVENLIAQISVQDVLCELQSNNLTLDEALMLLDNDKVWEYVHKDRNVEKLDGLFNANAPHKGITQYFNPPCEWFMEGMKMPMFKAEAKWQVAWKYVKAFTPTSICIETTGGGCGMVKLFGSNSQNALETNEADENEAHKNEEKEFSGAETNEHRSNEEENEDEENETLIDQFKFKVCTDILCFGAYNKYRLVVENWQCTGWVCQIVLK